jgi:hypothetical protein
MGDAVLAAVTADFADLDTDLIMPDSPHQLLQRHQAAP